VFQSVVFEWIIAFESSRLASWNFVPLLHESRAAQIWQSGNRHRARSHL